MYKLPLWHPKWTTQPCIHTFKRSYNDFFPTPLYLEDTRITWILIIKSHKRFLELPHHQIVLMEIFCITWPQMFLEKFEKKLLQMPQKGTPMFLISQVWKIHSTLQIFIISSKKITKHWHQIMGFFGNFQLQYKIYDIDKYQI